MRFYAGPMASETSPTAADICQHHIDAIESATLTSEAAVRAAVLDLLVLTRNTDVAARANRAEIDRELERIRRPSGSAIPGKHEGP